MDEEQRKRKAKITIYWEQTGMFRDNGTVYFVCIYMCGRRKNVHTKNNAKQDARRKPRNINDNIPRNVDRRPISVGARAGPGVGNLVDRNN